MSNGVRFRFTTSIRNKDLYTYALILVCIFSLGLSGCSGLVTASGGNPPPALAISGVQAANPTASGFQVSWSTNVTANSAVDYGKNASYGSSTPVSSGMVTSHQVALSGLTTGTLYHFRVRSTDAKGSNASSGDMTFATAGDTTPPTVSITSPAVNATLAGFVNVTANATDDVAVASVQFKVDNANTGPAITAAPYTYSLNTTTLSNGNHILTALAADTSGNTATSSVAVKVNNTVATVPSISSLNPTSGPVGTSVTIAGANFGAAQGTSTLAFNGIAATATNWGATSVTAAVPSGATTGNVVVTVAGVASNGVVFTVPVPTPSITSLNPTSGLVGTSVTIAGANFGATQGTSTVKFNGTTAAPTNWSATSITAAVPSGATTGNVVVTVGGAASNGMSFTVQADTTPPTVPTGLTATAVSSSQINLSWTASTDNVGVTGYNIFRGGVKVGTAPSTSFQDAGLNASTSYTYNVSAFDAAGNTSAQSSGASASTLASSGGGGIPPGLGWYQVPNTNIRPLCPNYSEIQANEGCTAVMADWSGGLFDTKRNRLVILGGGHQGYYGNEIYGIDLNANPVARLLVKDAAHGSAVSNVSSCPEAYLDGTPDARHNYSGLVYAAARDKYFMWSGSKSSCGFFSDGLWQFDPATNTWNQINYNGVGPTPAGSGSTPVMAYDGVNDALYLMEHNAAKFWRYTFSDNAWHVLFSGQGCNSLDTTATIDSSRRLFLCAGSGQMDKMLLDPPYTRTQVAGNGCATLRNANGPGYVYDPVNKVEVGWAGGNTAYIYNPDTDSCTAQTYSGGPTTVQANGTYGRFEYSPATGVFVVANDIDSNAYTLRLTAQSGGTGGPTISGVGVNGISTTGAAVTWTTDVAATSQVEYGTTTGYGNLTALDSTMVTSHTVTLTGLSINTVYHYRVRSKNSSGVESISGDAVFSTSNTTDKTPPTVSMTAPTSGATVSGSVTVSANATDNVGVTSVQFTLDGGNLGTALTASPYQVTWDTATAANGSHSLSAAARDAAGNVGNAIPVTVTVANSGNTALQDFQSRCATSGVIVCEGFDNASEFVHANFPSTGLYPGNDNSYEIVQDTSIFASGSGSLHYPIKANDGTGGSVRDDNWLQTFCSAHPPAACTPTVFAMNSTFYVQFRYRVDDAYVNTNWEDPANGGSSPKIADFAYHGSSCGQTEITTNNRGATGMPMMYTSCGGRGIYTLPGTTNFAPSSPPYSWQSGYYNCSYPSVPTGPGGCFKMPANTWMTFYYMVHLGNSGQPDSHIKAWLAVDGQPLQTFMDVTNISMTLDTPGYDAIWFNVYMTGFNASATNPAANAWLDEVIVSQAPIPAPGANGGGIPQ
jgi:hypothetical protein